MNFDMHRTPGFAISRTHQMQRAIIRKEIGQMELKLTPEEVVILIKLSTTEAPIRMGKLADKLQRDATTITRLLDGLERKNFVTRKQDISDRRAICVELTNYGTETLDRLIPCLEGIDSSMLKGISSEDLETTINTLLRIQENLSSNC